MSGKTQPQQPNLPAPAESGVMPARQARSRAARDKMLQAGEAVFARLGYDAAHVADIAAAADCSIGSFYRRFRDKEAFFQALLQRFGELNMRNAADFFAAPARRDQRDAEVIRAFVINDFDFIRENAGFIRALFQRTTAGTGSGYWPGVQESEAFRGRELTAFLRARGHDGDGFGDACFFAVRVLDGMIVHAVLRDIPLTDALTGDLTRMIAGYLNIPAAP